MMLFRVPASKLEKVTLSCWSALRQRGRNSSSAIDEDVDS